VSDKARLILSRFGPPWARRRARAWGHISRQAILRRLPKHSTRMLLRRRLLRSSSKYRCEIQAIWALLSHSSNYRPAGSVMQRRQWAAETARAAKRTS